MDDLFDLSPLEQELEALSAIYLDELKLYRHDDGEVNEIELLLHPATGDDTTKQFVCMNLVFQPTSKYPDDVPEIIIRNPRGLGEEEVVSLVEDMKKKALEDVGEMMLYTLIEMAKETLTHGNIPHCPCVVCLEHFHENDLFHRTACYHYYHNQCLHKYLEHSRLQIEQDKKEAAENKHLTQEAEEVPIVCPVCRTTLDDESLAVVCSETKEEEEEDYVIPPELREQQRKMAELYEKQRAKGAIIDIEWERNKFLVNQDERLPIPSTRMENRTEDTSSMESVEKVPSKDNDSRERRAPDKHQGPGFFRRHEQNRGSSNSHSKHQPRHRGEKYHGSNSRDRDRWQEGDRGRGGFGNPRDKNKAHFKTGYSHHTSRDYSRREESHRKEHVDFSEADSISDSGNDVSGRSFDKGKMGNTSNERDSGYESRRDKRFEEQRDNWRRGTGGSGRGGRDREYRTQTGGPPLSRERNYDTNVSRESGRGRGGHDREYRTQTGGPPLSNERNYDTNVSRESGRGRGGHDREYCTQTGRPPLSNERNYDTNVSRESGRGRGGHDREYRTQTDRPSLSNERNYDTNVSRESGSGRGQSRRNNLGSSSSSVGKDGLHQKSVNSNRDEGDEYDLSRHDGSFGDSQNRHESERGGGFHRGRGFRQRGGRGRGYPRHDRSQDSVKDAGAAKYPSHRYPESREDYSDDDFRKEHGGKQQHQRQEYNHRHRDDHNGQRRRTEFERGDNRRRHGYPHSVRSGEDGERHNKSDQHDTGSSSRAVSVNGDFHEAEEEDEEGRKKESDQKNVEINRRWRELNFGTESSQRHNRNQRAFHVIDDDDDESNYGNKTRNKNICDNNDSNVSGNESCPRQNPYYNPKDAHKFYTVASDEEEDWDQESDPFAYQRMHVRPEQYEQYKKYRDERYAYYDKKVTERANKQNAVREEKKRIQNERLRMQRNENVETIPQANNVSDNRSVLERFKDSQKQKEESCNIGKKTNSETIRQNRPVSPRVNGKEGFAEGKSSAQAAEYASKKSLPLPNRNKVEGIKWVGVRSDESDGVNHLDDEAMTVDGIAKNSAFEESWKRREEKDRRQRTKEEKNVSSKSCESNSMKSDSQGDRNLKTDHQDLCDDKDKRVLNGRTIHNERNRIISQNHVENDLSRKETDLGIPQRNPKRAKPLDFRKKNSHSNQTRFSSDHVEHLVQQLPSLLTDSSNDDGSKQALGQDRPQNGENIDLHSKSDTQKEINSKKVPNPSLNLKKPKPLDFRKGKSKES